MIKKNEIARGVRVKFNSNFATKCKGDENLQCEEVIYLSEGHVYNDSKGEYILITGGSGLSSGYAYLDELDLEFPYGQGHHYPVHYNGKSFKKEFIGFTRLFSGGVPVFFDDEGICVFDLKVKDEDLAWQIYSKRLKITIEELPSNDKD